MIKNFYDKDTDKLDRLASAIIEKNIEQFLKKQKKVSLGIVGGSSVSGIFLRLKHANIPWKNVHVYMVDERRVPISSDLSNYELAYKVFLRELTLKKLLPKENMHPFTLSKRVKGYINELKSTGRFDIVIVSAGEDGHIAALFPNHHSIKDKADYALQMDDAPKPPAKRVTVSYKFISKSKVGLVLFYGEPKRRALGKFKSRGNIEDCPVRLIAKIKKAYAFTNIK